MRALPLLLLTLLAGPTAQGSGAPTGCQDDNSDCREDCTVEYGSSSRTYAKLGSCLQRCKDTYDLCRERHFALQERENLGIEPETAPTPPSVPAEPQRYSSDDSGFGNDEAPASASSNSGSRSGTYRASDDETETPAAPTTASKGSSSEKKTDATSSARSEPSESTGRSGVYRASEPEPEPSKAPASTGKSEPAVASTATEPDSMDEDDPPPPPPKPKPAPRVEPPRPKPPPEPKKDIADWDPNGD